MQSEDYPFFGRYHFPVCVHSWALTPELSAVSTIETLGIHLLMLYKSKFERNLKNRPIPKKILSAEIKKIEYTPSDQTCVCTAKMKHL